MMAKTQSLSVHRNAIERRRKQEIAKRLTAATAKMVKDADIRAYAVVGIGSDGSAHALWDTGRILPIWAFPETISAILRRDIETSGVEEDWRPPIVPKA